MTREWLWFLLPVLAAVGLVWVAAGVVRAAARADTEEEAAFERHVADALRVVDGGGPS